MTAHQYGTGSFDFYGKSVQIPSGDKSLIGRADVEALRDKLTKALSDHRATSTRHMTTGEYKNPIREGFDHGLVHAIDEIENVLNADIIDRIIKGER
ncbi:hypothetical protein [Nocardia africana]